MGHVTVLGETAAECATVAAAIERDLGIAT